MQAEVVEVKRELRSALQDTTVPLILWLNSVESAQLEEMGRAHVQMNNSLAAKLTAFHADVDRQQQWRAEQAQKDQERHEALMERHAKTQQMISKGFEQTAHGQQQMVRMILENNAQGSRMYEVVNRLEAMLQQTQQEDDVQAENGSVASTLV